jgi:hypothetical protein
MLTGGFDKENTLFSCILNVQAGLGSVRIEAQLLTRLGLNSQTFTHMLTAPTPSTTQREENYLESVIVPSIHVGAICEL